MSTDIIPVPNEVSAHPGTKCHTMGACGHGIIVQGHPGTVADTLGACGHGKLEGNSWCVEV